MRGLFIVFLMAALFLVHSASATILTTERTQTTLISELRTIHAGEKFWVALHIQLAPGWHTYWANPGDSGITPQLKWTLPNGFTASPIQYLGPDREHVGPLVDYAYDNDAYYLVAITPPPILRTGATAILAVKASWLVCKDVCIPESGELSLALPAGEKPEPAEEAQHMAELVGRLPVPISTPITFGKDGDLIHFVFALKDSGVAADQIKNVLFFPESDGLIANAAEQKAEVKPDSVAFSIHRAEGKTVDHAAGLVSLFLNGGVRKDFAMHLQSEAGAAQADAVESKPVTPVERSAPAEPLPVAQPIPPGSTPPVAQPIPPADTGGSMPLATALIYAILGGLILNAMPCVFPVLSLKALAIAKKASAHPEEARAQGLAYAAGVIVSFLVLAVLLVAFQQGGQAAGWGYQMQSPVFVTLLAFLLFAIALNLAGYFELPVLLGNVGSEATAKHTNKASFLTGVLAVVVATPCTAPFMASAVGFALTQGAITIFAVFVALGLGLALPFLLISFHPGLIRALPKPGHWMVTFKEFLSFPMFAWTVWLLWVLARETGGDLVCLILLNMVLFAFALWLSKTHRKPLRLAALALGVISILASVSAAQAPAEFLASPSVAAEKFTPARLEELRKNGQAVFVDATADWCLICKVNEKVALSSPDVIRAFKDKQVSYLIADWTHGDEAITHYLESFGRSGVPIYVYYPPKDGSPVVLPQVLTPATVLEVLQ